MQDDKNHWRRLARQTFLAAFLFSAVGIAINPGLLFIGALLGISLLVILPLAIHESGR